jgi:proline dehydrogenase
MIRQGLLWLSEQQWVFDFARRNPLARPFARRFVAGEELDEAIAAARQLSARGITTTLDLLGESVSREADAVAARNQYVAILDRLAATDEGVEVNASLKLTQMGFDIDEELCFRNVAGILDRAKSAGGFVRIDMEGSAYTQRTLDFFADRILEPYGAHCGVVIQSCLRRSAADVERLIAMRARVRLCKGAYLEPPAVAFPDKSEVDRNYVQLMERLLDAGTYPAIATHDERIIEHARRYVQRNRIGEDRFEFQMLYGVRRDLQEKLRAAGHRMRVYVPFGTQWYPYLMRRLAERPANIAFILGNVVREGRAGR